MTDKAQQAHPPNQGIPQPRSAGLKTHLYRLYAGRSKRAEKFRYALLAFDIVTVCFFIAVSFLPVTPLILALDYAIAVVLIADFLARIWIAPHKLRHIVTLAKAADVVVIVSLLAPAFLQNLAFLRVLRTLRLLRSYHVIHDLRSRHRFFARNEEIIQSVINLLVFIFFVTALIYVLQVRVNPGINNYVDALYFTVTTLTTTGFGDITLQGTSGRLLSVFIMVFGVALFLRLVQTIFRPHKIVHECETCGLTRHDADAIHCKHCGVVLNIETEGG